MRVRDWMSPHPVTVDPSTSIREARRLLRHHGIRHLPVSEHGRVVGMISDRDVRIDDASLDALAAIDEIGGLPVVDGEHELLGVITTTDCLLASLGPREARSETA